MSLYRKLSELRNQFVCILRRDGVNKSGLLTEVTPDYITMIIYEDDGSRACEFTVLTSAVEAVFTGHRDEMELAARVSWAASERVEQETGGKRP